MKHLDGYKRVEQFLDGTLDNGEKFSVKINNEFVNECIKAIAEKAFTSKNKGGQDCVQSGQ